MIRVLVADDSATSRELLSAIFCAEAGLEVVGCATNGEEAVRLVSELQPDVVTMDIHMPVMDGFDATEEIMMRRPTPIVIVTSSLRAEDVAQSMRALRAGAVSVQQKPPGPTSPRFSTAVSELVAMVKAMAEVKVVRRRRATPLVKAEAPEPMSSLGSGAFRVIGIAASTGGPPALQRVLTDLGAGFPAPILLVQHIASGFTPGLVAWLASTTSLNVKLASRGEPLQAGVVYVAPEEAHLGVTARRTVALSTTPPVGGFRPSASALFESLASSFGADAMAVILTGMGDDGVEGARHVVEAGGRVVAQDKATSVVYGMPGAAFEAGIVHRQLPLEAIAREILLFASPRLAKGTD